MEYRKEDGDYNIKHAWATRCKAQDFEEKNRPLVDLVFRYSLWGPPRTLLSGVHGSFSLGVYHLSIACGGVSISLGSFHSALLNLFLFNMNRGDL
jgi:hypothetical protein